MVAAKCISNGIQIATKKEWRKKETRTVGVGLKEGGKKKRGCIGGGRVGEIGCEKGGCKKPAKERWQKDRSSIVGTIFAKGIM